MRKVFARVDAAALDRQLAVVAWTRTRHIQGARVIAIDGKTVRGARTGARAAPHLIAALDHVSGVVLGQNVVDAKSNEIPAVRDLLAGFDPADLHGCVVTVDAMHTQDTAAAILATAGATLSRTIASTAFRKAARSPSGIDERRAAPGRNGLASPVAAKAFRRPST